MRVRVQGEGWGWGARLRDAEARLLGRALARSVEEDVIVLHELHHLLARHLGHRAPPLAGRRAPVPPLAAQRLAVEREELRLHLVAPPLRGHHEPLRVDVRLQLAPARVRTVAREVLHQHGVVHARVQLVVLRKRCGRLLARLARGNPAHLETQLGILPHDARDGPQHLLRGRGSGVILLSAAADDGWDAWNRCSPPYAWNRCSPPYVLLPIVGCC